MLVISYSCPFESSKVAREHPPQTHCFEHQFNMAQLVEFEKTSCYTMSKGEASFIYKEIFEDGCYDISNLPEAPLVIDAGANIGLFSLYVKSKFPLSKIIAFEPAPETYEILRRNLELHNVSDVEALPVGLASKASTEKLTYFPKLPGNSTIKPDEKKKLFELAAKVNEQAAAHLRFEDSQQFDVQLERLSDILDTYPSFTRIDFLKIDVEGAELEVLRGLDDNHWDLVHNIIVGSLDSFIAPFGMPQSPNLP